MQVNEIKKDIYD